MDGLGEPGNVHDPKRPGGIPNPNLLHALTDRIHRLPVVRVLAVLYLIELMAGLAPCREGKATKVIQGTAPELDGLGIGHGTIIQNFVFSGNHGCA